MTEFTLLVRSREHEEVDDIVVLGSFISQESAIHASELLRSKKPGIDVWVARKVSSLEEFMVDEEPPLLRVGVRETTRDGAPWFEVMVSDQEGRDLYGACMGRSRTVTFAMYDFVRRANIEHPGIWHGRDLALADLTA